MPYVHTIRTLGTCIRPALGRFDSLFLLRPCLKSQLLTVAAQYSKNDHRSLTKHGLIKRGATTGLMDVANLGRMVKNTGTGCRILSPWKHHFPCCNKVKHGLWNTVQNVPLYCLSCLSFLLLRWTFLLGDAHIDLGKGPPVSRATFKAIRQDTNANGPRPSTRNTTSTNG